MINALINRRLLIAQAAAALALAGCDTGTSSTTVAQIVAAIQTSCGFVTSAQAIIPVILSLVSTFNAAAGAGSTVAVAIGQQVADAVCMAVKTHPSAAARAGAAESPSPVFTVNVNGVAVPGHLVGPKTMKPNG